MTDFESINQKNAVKKSRLLSPENDESASVLLIIEEAIKNNIFEKAVEEFGKVDILINNAGWGCKLPFLETDFASFDRSVNLNMKATYYMIQLACKQMIKQGSGGIVYGR